MKGGRKNLKRAVEEVDFTLQDAQSVMQVVSLRGSNLIEVMDDKGDKSLALFPAKFHKSMWIKRGSFVVVDTTGKEKAALESGSKVAYIVSKVLFYEQIRKLKKSPEWPEMFKTAISEDSNANMHESESSLPEENESGSSGDDDDDGLPPLEPNTNRYRPEELQSESDSDSDTECLN